MDFSSIRNEFEFIAEFNVVVLDCGERQRLQIRQVRLIRCLVLIDVHSGVELMIFYSCEV